MNFFRRFVIILAVVLAGALLGLCVASGIRWFWEGVISGVIAPKVMFIIAAVLFGATLILAWTEK
jgi:hypothetical protein